MKLIPTWPIAAACLAAGALLGAGADRLWMAPKVADRDAQIAKLNLDHREELRVREVQRAKDEVAARQEERRLVLAAQKIEQVKNDEIATVRGALAAANARVQNRPDRQPAGTGGVPAAAPACQSATGAELSRQDAEFLNGEAARGDELRAALSACYRAYDSIGLPAK